MDRGAFFDYSFIVAFGGGASTFDVTGDGCIARPATDAMAQDLADALDGEMATFSCEAT